ncbi:hemin receptor [Parashewanella spongiae]|uniref:Hemin receptor n=1 Tax=Parashewanella spongiae TaxID=342950 RepID=A0A3A6TXJ2_9GAMM|nr:globin family protein [Parashewanella spongiae]MCL1078090.1 globin domain-containing protein [Parashewanella spongiae]RJY16460.1 hemin receptor [Parashewanella spongiae]
MTPHQITIIQQSWENVLPIKAQAAEIFYNRLFELDPSLKPMFTGDIKQQGDKLMLTLSVAVNSLTRLETLIPILEDMARRHVDYGVQDKHYATVGQALIDTLATAFGDAFTDELKSAWTEMYQVVANTMINATQ